MSRILHVNKTEQKKGLPEVVTKCMRSKIKYHFLAVQLNPILCADLTLINNMQVPYEAKAFLPFLYLFVQANSVKITWIYAGTCLLIWSKRKLQARNNVFQTRLEKNENRQFSIRWTILKQILARRNGKRNCTLCLEEKLMIMKGHSKNILTRRSVMLSKCR